MFQQIKFIIQFTLIICVVCGCAASSRNQFLNKPAPPARYTLMNGDYHALSELRGKTVVLSFWDAGCSHCKQIIPRVNELARIFSDRSDMAFLAVSINTLQDEEKVKETIKDLSLDSLQHVFSGNDVLDETFRSFDGSEVPYIVVVDKGGVVRWIGGSFDEMKENLLNII